jgi:hypothetical protein
MNWQIRYMEDDLLATRTVNGLEAAIDEAGRLIEAGRDVRRIEAPGVGCAVSLATIREFCVHSPVPAKPGKSLPVAELA